MYVVILAPAIWVAQGTDLQIEAMYVVILAPGIWVAQGTDLQIEREN